MMFAKVLREIFWWLNSKSSYIGRIRYELLKWKFINPGYKCSLGKDVRFLGKPKVSLSDRVTIRAFTIIGGSGALKIGSDSVINEGVIIACTSYVEIGRNCMIAPRVYLLDVDHKFDSPDKPIAKQGCISSPIIIGDDVWIGAQAVILRGVKIGSGAIIGANCVVTHDVPSLAVVGGVPGRVIKNRNQ